MLREGGKFVTVSDDTNPDTLERRATIAAHNYVGHDPKRRRELVRLVDEGSLLLRITERYPLARVVEAHRRAGAIGLLGKVVITM